MNTENRLVIFFITDNGFGLAEKIRQRYPGAEVLKFDKETVYRCWMEHARFVFIMAAGIVVRTVAPLIRDKKDDPPVIVIDEKGKYVISLLGGHLGGANSLAEEIAEALGAQPVVTTASDIHELPAIDLWAQRQGLVIEDWGLLPKIGTKMINTGTLKVHSDIKLPFPTAFQKVENPALADILITNRKLKEPKNRMLKKKLYLRPKNIIIGSGCNSGTPAEEIEEAVRTTLEENNLAFASLHSLATIDLKASEKGLIEFSRKYGLEIRTFTPEELNRIDGTTLSEAALRATGARSVAEPAALLASGSTTLLVPKQKIGNVTVAAAELSQNLGESNASALRRGKLYIVGTGPGSPEHITPYAQQAIRESDVIVGYGTYLDLIEGLLQGKEIVSTRMTQEIDRCRKALEIASGGRTVSVISGGDPGIYAMAGLVLELAHKEGPSGEGVPSIEIIPGISALNACASRLGAPLMHDFASVSLSDRLTPWSVIEKRLDAAAVADFVIALYNPKSKGRSEHIDSARDIIMRYRKPSTPVGIVRGAMRKNERIVLTDLQNMTEFDIDMQTTVIIGNSTTFLWDGWMVTPRGYEKKRQFNSTGS